MTCHIWSSNFKYCQAPSVSIVSCLAETTTPCCCVPRRRLSRYLAKVDGQHDRAAAARDAHHRARGHDRVDAARPGADHRAERHDARVERLCRELACEPSDRRRSESATAAGWGQGGGGLDKTKQSPRSTGATRTRDRTLAISAASNDGAASRSGLGRLDHDTASPSRPRSRRARRSPRTAARRSRGPGVV